jgi:methyl-accepting chemotaxis protein
MLTKLRISHRLYGGFGLLVVLAIIASAVAYLLLGTIADEVSLAQQLSTNALRNLETGRMIEIMRRSTQRFSVSADPQAKLDFDENSAKAISNIQTQIDKALSAQRKANYAEVKGGLETEQKDFAVLARLAETGVKTKADLVTETASLDAAAIELAKSAAATDDRALADAVANTQQAIMRVGVTGWQFLATTDPRAATMFHEAVDRAQAALKQIGQQSGAKAPSPEVAAALADRLTKYAGMFAGAADALANADTVNRDGSIERTVETMDQTRASLLTSADGAAVRAAAALSTAEGLQLGLIAVILVLGGTLAFRIARGIARPLHAITATMRVMASGNTAVEIPGKGRVDEIGDMAAAIEVFKNSMVEREQFAERERLDQAEKARRAAAMKELNEAFSAAFHEVGVGIVNASVAVDTDSKSLTSSAKLTREQADAVAQASAGASRNVETVAAAAEELRASIAEINGQVVTAASASTKAVEQSNRAGETVKGLAVAAERIGQVVDLINSIASQTNLLALNATIEAARAGDAGKGFAVVAAEVKGLANQTANATGEIQAQVAAIQQETSRAVEAITDIAQTIGSIQEITTSVAGAVEQQSAATAEISRSVQQASLGSREVAQAISHVSTATDTTAHAIESLRRTSAQLSTHATLLQSEVNEFVEKARSF